VLLPCLLIACSGDDDADGATTTAGEQPSVAVVSTPAASTTQVAEVESTSVPSDAEVLEAIEGFDVSEPANVGPRAALTISILTDPESTRTTAKNLVVAGDPDVRLAAIYALSTTLTPADVDALLPILESADPQERVLAAGGLLTVGDARAVPVLIALLAEETLIALGFPPVPVWERARVALLNATGQQFGLREATTAEAAAATIPDWEAWWAGAAGDFHVVLAEDPFG
jgi:HEAT repeat protein